MTENGFRQNHSTELQIATILEKSKRNVTIVHRTTKLRKVLVICQKGPINKLNKVNLPTQLIKLTGAYLTNRTNKVNIKCEMFFVYNTSYKTLFCCP